MFDSLMPNGLTSTHFTIIVNTINDIKEKKEKSEKIQTLINKIEPMNINMNINKIENLNVNTQKTFNTVKDYAKAKKRYTGHY